MIPACVSMPREVESLLRRYYYSRLQGREGATWVEEEKSNSFDSWLTANGEEAAERRRFRLALRGRRFFFSSFFDTPTERAGRHRRVRTWLASVLGGAPVAEG